MGKSILLNDLNELNQLNLQFCFYFLLDFSSFAFRSYALISKNYY